MKPRSLFSIILLSLGIFIGLGHPAMGNPPIFTNSLGMRFIFIPAGSFTMGSPPSEPGRNWNEKQHRVTITKGFYMGETEVTQGQWSKLVSPNPSAFKRGPQYPVDSVSWNQVIQFIGFLNIHEKATTYRLPTEAEWEYACRAGSKTAFSNGPITNQTCILPEPALEKTAWYC
ncbi:MAG: formylglycine-generating enzyme family protein, partial [Desulfovibrionales bacterium]|nr:formylglycine-generating enzyme family protein [Desulfovibrionales bacterium]